VRFLGVDVVYLFLGLAGVISLLLGFALWKNNKGTDDGK